MFEEIKSFLVNNNKIDPSIIKPETAILDLGISSLDLFKMVLDFEKQFNISISDRELSSVHVVDDLVRLAEKKC